MTNLALRDALLDYFHRRRTYRFVNRPIVSHKPLTRAEGWGFEPNSYSSEEAPVLALLGIPNHHEWMRQEPHDDRQDCYDGRDRTWKSVGEIRASLAP